MNEINKNQNKRCDQVEKEVETSDTLFGGISGFAIWLMETGESEQKTCSYLKYLQALNRFAKLCGIITCDIFTIEAVEELEDIQGKIERNPIWGKLKSSGHKRYSSTMLKYIEYVRTFMQPQENISSQNIDNYDEIEEPENELIVENDKYEIENCLENTETQSEEQSYEAIILGEGSKQEFSRHEMEEMYQDSINLIVCPADTVFLSECRKTEEIDEYTRLRNRIMEEFPKVKLLCEIEISDREYSILCQHERKHYLSLMKNHTYRDIILSVTLVQIGIRNYRYAYWPHVAEVLGCGKKASLIV